MPQIVIRTSIAAGARVNVVQGSIYEFMPFAAAMELALVQLSGAIGDILGTVTSGSDTLQEESPISAAARFPSYPDDFVLTDDVAPGDRLAVNLRNTTAGAIVVVTAIKLNPMG